MPTKKFTILHSNDMHGDFLADGPSKVVSTSAQEVLEEYLRNRLVYV